MGKRRATRCVRAGLIASAAVVVGVAIAVADPPKPDNNDPGSDIFDMGKKGSPITPTVPPPATAPADRTPEPATPTPVIPTPAVTRPAVPTTVLPPLPVPSAAERAAAAKAVDDAYASDIAAAAKSVDARRRLAVKLLAAAADEPGPANQFALLDTARATAAGAGDLRLATFAIDAEAARFGVDAAKLRALAATVILRTNGGTDGDRRVTLLRAAVLADALAADARGDLLPPLESAIADAANNVGGPALVAQVKAAAATRAAAATAAATVAKQRTVLRSKPADPAANEAVGRYDCLTAGDWATGLPRLAAGADPALRAAAAADLKGASTADGAVAVGDAWLATARPATGAAKATLMARAAHWYAVAQPLAVGLTRAKVDARLNEIASAPAVKPTGPALPRLVDLLATADPERDTVHGDWHADGPDLASGTAPGTSLGFRYRPPREYDFHVVFTRTGRNDGLDLLLCGGGDASPASGRPFKFTLGGWDNTVAGFGWVDGRVADGNPSTAKGHWLVNGKRYTLVVRVRADRVEALLDDRRISSVQTDNCRDLGLELGAGLRRSDVLGIQAWDSNYKVHAADVIEVTGRGQVVADDDPDTSAKVARLNYVSPGGTNGWLDVFADGRTLGQTGGRGLWYQHGSTLHFQWDRNVDTVQLSADHRSFAGRDLHKGHISGTVISGSL